MTNNFPEELVDLITETVDATIEAMPHARRLYPDVYAREVALSVLRAIPGLKVTTEWATVFDVDGEFDPHGDYYGPFASVDEAASHLSAVKAEEPTLDLRVANRLTLHCGTDWEPVPAPDTDQALAATPTCRPPRSRRDPPQASHRPHRADVPARPRHHRAVGSARRTAGHRPRLGERRHRP